MNYCEDNNVWLQRDLSGQGACWRDVADDWHDADVLEAMAGEPVGQVVTVGGVEYRWRVCRFVAE